MKFKTGIFFIFKATSMFNCTNEFHQLEKYVCNFHNFKILHEKENIQVAGDQKFLIGTKN